MSYVRLLQPFSLPLIQQQNKTRTQVQNTSAARIHTRQMSNSDDSRMKSDGFNVRVSITGTIHCGALFPNVGMILHVGDVE